MDPLSSDAGRQRITAAIDASEAAASGEIVPWRQTHLRAVVGAALLMVSLPALLHRTRIGSAALPLLLAALLLGGFAHPAQAQYDPFHTPVLDSILAAEDSIAAAGAAQADTSDDDPHAVIRGLNALSAFIPFRLFEVLLVLSFMVIPVMCAGGFAAVALFMESGCLRIGLAMLGWGSALLGGLIIGGLLGTALGGLSFFGWTGVIVGGLGYPILFLRARKKIEQLPRAEYLTWKLTLTGGALIGTGASSAASLGRSAGALFKGGGGSFGGGGASGAFGGGQIAQVTAAAAQGTGAPGAVVLTSNTAPVAVGAVSTGMASAGTTESADGKDRVSATTGSRIRQFGHAVRDFMHRLRWYHGVAFVFIVLVFLPVGMGVTTIFQRPRLLLWIVGFYALCRTYWLVFRIAPEGEPPQAITAIFTMLLVSSPFIGGALAAASQAPQRHLVITLIITVLVEIGYFVLPNNLSRESTQTDREAPFRGGDAAEQW